ncbi:MAG: hypothetical protein R8F63_02250 [Acidimicrobiales bacterium]|nr:hypothetical protein [Acidimicrobiales bacterium]
MIVLVIVQTIAIAVLAVIVFGLLRTHADILRALDRAGVPLEDGPAAGGVGPVPVADPRAKPTVSDVVGTVPGGGPVSVSVGGEGHTLLAFLSSGCRTCQTFWSEFTAPTLELPGTDTRLVIVAQDPAHDSESKLAELAPAGVRTVCSSAAWHAYEVPGSPYFVLVDGDEGRIVGSGTATGWPQVHALLEQALGDEALDGSADAALTASGIGPGHPSLYPDESGPALPEDVD